MKQQEILELAYASPLRKHARDLSLVLGDPSFDHDRSAEKVRLIFARYLRDLWNKRDERIRALGMRETYPRGEPHSWLSILSCYGAFKPDFAYFEAQRPEGSFILLRKRSERLTSEADWFDIKAPIVIHKSEVAHAVGCDSHVVISLTTGDRILLTHHQLLMNPDDEFMQPYNVTGAVRLD